MLHLLKHESFSTNIKLEELNMDKLMIDIMKELITVAPSIFAIFAIYSTTKGEKDKLHYKQLLNKRDDYFETFIEKCALPISNPGIVLTKQYISDLTQLEAKVLLYANDKLSQSLLLFLKECKAIYDKYQEEYSEKMWNVDVRIESYMDEGLIESGQDMRILRLETEEYIHNEIMNFLKTNVEDTHFIKHLENICREMKSTLDSLS